MAAATLATDEPAAEPRVVGQVLAIWPADIDVVERIRPLDPVWAAALAKIMVKEGGQKTPIRIFRPPGRRWRLVAGLHRLEACRINGSPVEAMVDTDSGLERRRSEISENLFRTGLSPLDRAAFIAELCDLERAHAGVANDVAPQSIAAQARWAKALKTEAGDASVIVTRAYGFADDVATAVGLSRETIYRDLLLHRGLPPALAAQLRSHPVAANAGQLRALAKMAEADQRAVVELLLQGHAKGATDALATIRQKPKPDMAKKAYSAFFGGWSRMTKRAQRDALRELADDLPPGVRIVFDEAANG